MRWFSVISRTLVGGGVLPICRGAVGIFYSPSRLDTPPGLKLRGARSIAWKASFCWECWRSLSSFWECRMYLGYGPSSQTYLKKRSCATLAHLVERSTNTKIGMYENMHLLVHCLKNYLQVGKFSFIIKSSVFKETKRGVSFIRLLFLRILILYTKVKKACR